MQIEGSVVKEKLRHTEKLLDCIDDDDITAVKRDTLNLTTNSFLILDK